MNGLFHGIMLGFGVSVPIGPINVLIMSYALKSYTKALCLGLGAMSADAFYLLLSAFGVSKLVQDGILFKIIAIFGAIFLIYMAYEIYKNAKQEAQLKSVECGSHLKIYIKGILLNLLNPYVILFWLSVSTTISKLNAPFEIVLLGLVFAIALWITLFPLFVYKNRSKISTKASEIFAYISAGILLFFALRLLWKIFVS